MRAILKVALIATGIGLVGSSGVSSAPSKPTILANSEAISAQPGTATKGPRMIGANERILVASKIPKIPPKEGSSMKKPKKPPVHNSMLSQTGAK